MYICITCKGSNVRAGENVILERDEFIRDAVVRIAGGTAVGIITPVQPEGCISKSYILQSMGCRKICARVAIRNNDIALLYIDGSQLDESPIGVTMSGAHHSFGGAYV